MHGLYPVGGVAAAAVFFAAAHTHLFAARAPFGFVAFWLPAGQIGYAGGIEQTLEALQGMVLGEGSVLFVPMCFALFFSAVQIQFEIREAEMRAGIFNRF